MALLLVYEKKEKLLFPVCLFPCVQNEAGGSLICARNPSWALLMDALLFIWVVLTSDGAGERGIKAS